MKRICLILILLIGCNKSEQKLDCSKIKIDSYERCRLLVLEENIISR